MTLDYWVSIGVIFFCWLILHKSNIEDNKRLERMKQQHRKSEEATNNLIASLQNLRDKL